MTPEEAAAQQKLINEAIERARLIEEAQRKQHEKLANSRASRPEGFRAKDDAKPPPNND